MMKKVEEALLNEIAETIEYWSQLAISDTKDNSLAFAWASRAESLKVISSLAKNHGLEKELGDFVYEFLYGFAHSMLTTFDGGSKLADQFPLNISSLDGEPLCKYLHELLPDIRFERESERGKAAESGT